MLTHGRYTATGKIASILGFLLIIGFATPTSVHNIAAHKGRNSTSNQDHGLRSASSKVSSLGNSENTMLMELKEIVLFLSQKIDDSDARIKTLEDKIKEQDRTIEKLKSDIHEASSFHRYLQSSDSDCLPMFRNTTFGPRCDFNYVTRFQDRVFFNDDVVFNENVEFDSDANCMPTFNSTTRMCSLNNNFTYDDGDIIFRDDVRMESDVKFKNGGEVTFDKEVKFHEDVLISNKDHDIEFKVDNRVTPRFYQDYTFKVDSHSTFYKNVRMEKDLKVLDELTVEGKTEMDDLELWGSLWVDHEARIDGELKANHHATIKSGLTVETGKLQVKRDGAQISGTTQLDGTFRLNGFGYAKRDFDVDGKFTANRVVIDSRQSNNRNLQFNFPTPAPTPPPPAFEVFGNANIDGTLTADRIRSDDINAGTININDIIDQVMIELENGDLIIGDITIINNINRRGEKVLTESRMIELIKSMDLNVNKVTANTAQIGGKEYPNTDSEERIMTADEIVGALKGQDMEFGSVSVSKMNALQATIGGESYPQAASGGVCDCKIQDIVNDLNKYKQEVKITNLKSQNLEIVRGVEEDLFGNFKNVLGTFVVNGQKYVNATTINSLRNRIKALENAPDTPAQQQDVTSADILEALEGTDLSVLSLDTNSLKKSGDEVATMIEVNEMIQQAQLTAETRDVTCTCGSTEVEAIVTPDYLEGLGVSFGNEEPQECSCSADFVESVITPSYIESLDISSGGEATCSCSVEDIEDVVTTDYVSDLGFLTAGKIGNRIRNLVDTDYLEDLGFCTCGSSGTDWSYTNDDEA